MCEVERTKRAGGGEGGGSSNRVNGYGGVEDSVTAAESLCSHGNKRVPH